MINIKSVISNSSRNTVHTQDAHILIELRKIRLTQGHIKDSSRPLISKEDTPVCINYLSALSQILIIFDKLTFNIVNVTKQYTNNFRTQL